MTPIPTTTFTGRDGRTGLPTVTSDPEQSARDLDDWGYCFVADALDPVRLAAVRCRLIEQARGR